MNTEDRTSFFWGLDPTQIFACVLILVLVIGGLIVGFYYAAKQEHSEAEERQYVLKWGHWAVLLMACISAMEMADGKVRWTVALASVLLGLATGATAIPRRATPARKWPGLLVGLALTGGLIVIYYIYKIPHAYAFLLGLYLIQVAAVRWAPLRDLLKRKTAGVSPPPE